MSRHPFGFCVRAQNKLRKSTDKHCNFTLMLAHMHPCKRHIGQMESEGNVTPCKQKLLTNACMQNLLRTR